MRSFLAALLQSDLSTGELEELAKEFSNGAISLDLSNLISDAISSLADVGHIRVRNEPSNALTAQAYTTIMN